MSAAPITSSSASVPSAAATNSTSSFPIASVGILTDIQCADLPDGTNYTKTEARYYRHALIATRRALEAFANSQQKSGGEFSVSRVMHFGDLIDGWNADASNDLSSEEALQNALSVLPVPASDLIIPTTQQLIEEAANAATAATAASSSTTTSSSASATPFTADDKSTLATLDSNPFPTLRCYHLLGNHELMNFPRSRWARELGMGYLSRAALFQAMQKGLFQKKHDATIEKSLQEISGGKPLMFRQSSQLQQDLTKEVENFFPASPNSDKSKTASSSSIPPFLSSSPMYYDLVVANRYRLIMLDAYDITVLGYADMPSHPNHTVAYEFLEKENPNQLKASPLNLEGIEKRKVSYNGGVGELQLKWLVHVLEESRAANQFVILCSHVGFHPSSAHISALLWNQQEVMAIVKKYSDVILACLSGHDHEGGHVEEGGVIFHTLEAILTTPDGSDAYGRMDFYQDKIVLQGVDRMSSFSINVPNSPADRRGKS